MHRLHARGMGASRFTAPAAARELRERQARVVEIRAFASMTSEEIAHVLGVSVRTVDGDWCVAKASLRRKLAC